MKRYIIPIVLLMGMSPAFAQLDNTVEVTNEVKPVVKDADKINVFPNALSTEAKHTEVQYLQQSQPLTEFAQEPLRNYDSDVVDKGNKRGYAHIGGGSHGQVDAKAAYQFALSDEDALNLGLKLDGYNGKALEHSAYPFDFKSRMYKTRAGAKYNHEFINGLDLFAKGAIENHRFNYMQSFGHDKYTDKQHNMMSDFAVGFEALELGDFTLSAEGGAKFFKQKYATVTDDKLGETILNAEAMGNYMFTDEHQAELGVEFFKSSYSPDGLKGISHLHFTPHYIYKGDDFRAQVGIVAGTDGDIAPDVRLAYRVNPRSEFYLNAIGYERENDLRRLTTLHPYFAFGGIGNAYREALTIDAEFHTIDASLGFRFSNAKGNISGNFNAGYDRAKECALADWVANTSHGIEHPLFMFGEQQRFYLNADITFAYKDRVKVDLKNQFNAWKYRMEGNEDWTNGSYMDPTLDLRWSVDVKIIKDLYAGVNWNIGYFDCPDIDVIGGKRYERPTTNNLGLSVHYSVPVDDIPLSIFVKGDNLLNQKYDKYFYYRTIGANVMAGVAVSF